MNEDCEPVSHRERHPKCAICGVLWDEEPGRSEAVLHGCPLCGKDYILMRETNP